jgi:NADH-quinone oxidoreductase subunit J
MSELSFVAPLRARRGSAASHRAPSVVVLWFTGALVAALALLAGGEAAAQDIAFAVGRAAPRPSTGVLAAFYVLGGLTVAGAIATITRRNPVTAAVCLVGTLATSAGLYLLLHASFIAVIQVLVYAGAIMVLFVLVVMAVERPEREESGLLRGTVTKLVGVAAGGYFLARLIKVVMGPEVKTPVAVAREWGDLRTIGKLLFSDYLFPFEAISVLLLVAIVGAVVVSRRRRSEDRSVGAAPEPADAALPQSSQALRDGSAVAQPRGGR